MDNILRVLKDFVLETFLPGERESALAGDTPLLENAVIDSVGLVQFVSFIEERFQVAIDGHEINDQNFADLDAIAALVSRKLGDGNGPE